MQEILSYTSKLGKDKLRFLILSYLILLSMLRIVIRCWLPKTSHKLNIPHFSFIGKKY
jgi:hypothetical protein